MKDFTRVGRIEPQALANAAATQKTNNNSVLVSMVTEIGTAKTAPTPSTKYFSLIPKRTV
jgi:hypothetical protein